MLHHFLPSASHGVTLGAVAWLCLVMAACAPSTPPAVPASPPVKEVAPALPEKASDERAPRLTDKQDEATTQTIPPVSDNQSRNDQTDKSTAQDVRTAALIAEIDKALDVAEQEDAQRQPTDEIGEIIWEIEQADNRSIDNSSVPSFADLVPEGRDPSLEKEALEAAFAMLRAPEVSVSADAFFVPPKAETVRRIGIFVPLSGPRAVYGKQVSEGVEMAYFQLRDPGIELLYFDSAADGGVPAMAAMAKAAEIDIAIGPLFSDKADEIYPYFAAQSVPVLSLSNNQNIARSGLWVLGLLPEQQIDALLAKTLLAGHDQIAILSDLSAYGSQLTDHVTNRLTDFGVVPSRVMVIDGAVGADDETLVAQLKEFAVYEPLEEDQLVQDKPAPYDAVILAGGAEFVLKVAPLLSYYDLGPDRVQYLGTDLWASAGLLGEPSLQGAYVSTISPKLRTAFGARYQAVYQGQGQSQTGSFLSQLGFDVMAVAATATQMSANRQDNASSSLQNPVISRLVRDTGYKGFTGTFRLLANGQNQRQFSVFQVENGGLVTAEIAPKIAPQIVPGSP